MSDRPDLSLIVALYYEEECVEEFVRQVRAALDDEDLTYEIVFVDDGSQDRTVELTAALCADDDRIKLVQLSRNHGKEAAVTAGIEHARGRWMLMMDPDLQDPPERIVDFYQKAQEGYDLVFGVRKERSASLSTRLFSKVFWTSLNWMTGLQIPTGLSVMRIFNRPFAEAFLQHKERVRFIEGIFMLVGMRRTTLEVEHRPRFAGQTKFNFRRRMRLALNAMIAFSDKPLQLGISFGVTLLAATSLWGLYAFIRKLVFGIGMSGWTSTILVILLLGSVQIILLGLIGSYLGRLYAEAKARPIYGVQRTFNLDEQAVPLEAARPTPVRELGT